ncbi:MAG: DUF4339 domain-containing protein [Verrucomicrobiae bacterium]|nr:DUF4339 domain-containing protein [Verrucomicrobiae bacterium]
MKYHLSRNGKTQGTFFVEELRRMLDTGELDGTEFVWREGTEGWLPVRTVLKLEPVPPPIPPRLGNQRPRDFSHRSGTAARWAVGVIVTAGLAAMLLLGGAGYRWIQASWQRVPVAARSAGNRPAAMVAASKPVSTGARTTTAADARNREREFREREFLEGFQQRGEHNPQSDSLAPSLIQQWAKAEPDIDSDTNLPALRAAGNRLAADPDCTDPLALTVAAVTSTELHEANHRLERALKGFENSKHRAFPKFFNAVTLANKLVVAREDRISQLDSLALDQLKQAFTDGSLRPEDEAELGEIMVNGWGAKFFQRQADEIVKLVESQAKPRPWLALTLRGENEINKAWAARGTGYANAVTSAGWQGFNEHLANARAALTKAWKLNPELPLAPCLLITVSLGDSDITEMRHWFDQTTMAQIDYAPAWKEMRWGLRPRWYGDRAAMLAFGVTALNTRRFDSDAPKMFFDSVRDIDREFGHEGVNTIYQAPDIWPRMKEMFEGYIATVKDVNERDDWRTQFAVVAYLNGQNELAAGQLEAMNWQPHKAQLTGWGRDVSLLTKHVRAYAGAMRPQLQQAAQASRDIDSSQASYDQILANPQADAATLDYAHEREASLRLMKQFRTGNWFDFLPVDTNFCGWNVVRGRFTVEPDGSLEVKSDENGHLIYARMPVRTGFEMRGEYVVESSTTKAFQGGLIMGLPEFETYNWYAFRVKRNDDEGDVVSFSQHWTTRQLAVHLALNPTTNSFYFRFQKGLVTASVNGHEVFKDAPPPKDTDVDMRGAFLGLGAFNDSNLTAIRYRNVQLRSLSAAPAR